MQERRRAELEAKRAKLEEVRRQRKERQEHARREQTLSSTNTATATREEADRLLRDLASNRDSVPAIPAEVHTPISSFAGTPPTAFASLTNVNSALSQSGRASRASAAGSDDLSFGTHALPQSASERFAPDLIEFDQELFELPQKERVVYSKEVQTTDLWDGIEANDIGVGHEIKQPKIVIEQSREDREFEEESLKLDKEIEDEIREMTEEERATLLLAPEFLEFIDHSSKILQRALSDNYDYTRDYTIGAEAGSDDSEGKRVKLVCAFSHERWTKNRSVTDVDWSPKYPELSVASYSKNHAALNEPDGIVAVWNLHMLDRPEFVFHSQSDVLSVVFSPFHANLVFGGTYAGQILLWDTRSKHLPILKTPLSAAGHTHPVYAMEMVGTQNAHNLITSSTDGLVCGWLVDMLAQPQESLELIYAGHNKTNEIAITSLDFPDNETTTFWVGTEEGNIYQANRYDRAGSKAGVNQSDVYRGHAGPVTGIHFHPIVGPIDFSDLFLSSSVDWTVKLWRAKSLTKQTNSPSTVSPLYSFDESDDYVYDVRWHPTHPAVFGSVNGSGKFDLWNLNNDTEVPVVSTTIGSGRAVNKLKWDRKDGRRAALGSSDGKLYICDIGDMALPRETEWTDLQRTIASLSTAGVAGGMDSSAMYESTRLYR